MVDRLPRHAEVAFTQDLRVRVRIPVPAGEIAGGDKDAQTVPGFDDDAGRPQVDSDLLRPACFTGGAADSVDDVERPPFSSTSQSFTTQSVVGPSVAAKR